MLQQYFHSHMKIGLDQIVQWLEYLTHDLTVSGLRKVVSDLVINLYQYWCVEARKHVRSCTDRGYMS